MTLKFIYLTVLLMGQFAIIGCDSQGESSNDTTCDDLSLVWLEEIDSSSISVELTEAIDVYHSIQGEWRGIYDCIDSDPEEITIEISDVSDSYVELYQELESADCDFFGQATYALFISDSNDVDIEGKLFLMTADLLIPVNSNQQNWSLYYLSAQSDVYSSDVDNILSFRLKMTVDYDWQIKGSKWVTTEITEDDNDVVSQAQGDLCLIKDIVAVQ